MQLSRTPPGHRPGTIGPLAVGPAGGDTLAAQAAPAGIQSPVTITVGVAVGVIVGVDVAVGVGVAVDVTVGVKVGDSVVVPVTVGVIVTVILVVGRRTGILVAVGVGVLTGATVAGPRVGEGGTLSGFALASDAIWLKAVCAAAAGAPCCAAAEAAWAAACAANVPIAAGGEGGWPGITCVSLPGGTDTVSVRAPDVLVTIKSWLLLNWPITRDGLS